ncbi:class I SAM-dependent methyltransferase [Streptomyces sp. NPDC002520]
MAEFLSAHPDTTVVEIGTGLNTRHERVDNGRARWFGLDLPDVIALRRSFFADSPRRTMIAASVTDEAWAAEVASHAAGPFLFVAEAVLPYLHEPDVRRVIDLLADGFPGALLALDTAGPGFFGSQEQHDALSKAVCTGTAPTRLNWPIGGRGHAYWRRTASPAFPNPSRPSYRPPTSRRCPQSPRSDSPRPRTTGTDSCARPDIRRHAPRTVPAVTPPSHGRIQGPLCERRDYQEDLVTPGRKPAWACSRTRTRDRPNFRR